jgi:hypothetical protein
MSQKAVSLIVQVLLTNAAVRRRFARHPLGVLAELQFCTGVELTADEMRAFARVDPDLWSSSAHVTRGRVH